VRSPTVDCRALAPSADESVVEAHLFPIRELWIPPYAMKKILHYK
jgi:hypothetical protein